MWAGYWVRILKPGRPLCSFRAHKKDAHIRSAETAKQEKAAGRGNVLLYLLHPVSGEYSKPYRYREVTGMNLLNNNRGTGEGLLFDSIVVY